VLFGAAEGTNKWNWIMWGSAPIIALTLGFVFFNKRGTHYAGATKRTY